MALRYDPPLSAALRQGEILGELWVHVPQFPPIEIQPGQSFPFNSFRHEMVIVMSPDCDLEWDFKARFPDQLSQEQLLPQQDITESSSSISHVFLAEVYTQERIRPLINGSDIWRRIKNNQDIRYHHFEGAHVGEPSISELPDLYIDFKKALAISTISMYEGLQVGAMRRIALVPDKYVHHLIHRYYGFLSRVALPD